jgi:hypothetical protein
MYENNIDIREKIMETVSMFKCYQMEGYRYGHIQTDIRYQKVIFLFCGVCIHM